MATTENELSLVSMIESTPPESTKSTQTHIESKQDLERKHSLDKNLDLNLDTLFQGVDPEMKKQLETLFKEGAGTLLAACFFLPDGSGDLPQFMKGVHWDVLAPIVKLMPFKILRVVMCAKSKETEAQIKLKAKNMEDTYLIVVEDSLMSVLELGTPVTETKIFKEYLKQNSVFRAAMKEVTCVFNHPTKEMDIILPAAANLHKSKLPFVSSSQHAALAYVQSDEEALSASTETLIFDNNVSYRNTGFAPAHHGVYFEKNSNVPRETAIHQFKDKVFLNILTNRKFTFPKTEDERKSIQENFVLDQKQAAEFLAGTTVIPGYFQAVEDRQKFLVPLLQGMLGSEIITSSEFQDIVFVLDGKNFDINKMDAAYCSKMGYQSLELATLTIDEVGNIQAVNKAVKIFQKTTDTSKPLKRVRIIQGYKRFDEDYPTLLNLSQFFYPCSGDASLETALSRNLIPIYLCKQYMKPVLIDFEALLRRFFPDNALSAKFIKILYKEPQDHIGMASALSNEMFKEWQECVSVLRSEYNFYDALTDIYTQMILMAHLNNLKRSNAKDPRISPLNDAIELLENRLHGKERKFLADTLKFLNKGILEKLRLTGMRFKDEEFIELCKAATNAQGLKTVEIGILSETLSDPCMEAFCSLMSNNKGIKELHVIYAKMTSSQVNQLISALKGKNIEILTFNATHFNQRVSQSIASFIRSDTLQSFYICKNGVNDQSFLTICEGIAGSKTLREFSVQYNPITDKGLERAAVFIRQCKTLEEVEFRYNPTVSLEVAKRLENEFDYNSEWNKLQQMRRVIPEESGESAVVPFFKSPAQPDEEDWSKIMSDPNYIKNNFKCFIKTENKKTPAEELKEDEDFRQFQLKSSSMMLSFGLGSNHSIATLRHNNVPIPKNHLKIKDMVGFSSEARVAETSSAHGAPQSAGSAAGAGAAAQPKKKSKNKQKKK